MEIIRQKILRIHGSVILIVGIALTIASTIGKLKGIGPFNFLQENSFAHFGLMQAYLLMSIMGIVLWLGSFQEKKIKFNIVGALIHLPPLAANIIFYNDFVSMGKESLAMGAIITQCVFILLETVAVFYKKTTS